MWPPDAITIEIDEVEGSIMIIRIGVPIGVIEVVGSVSVVGRVLHINEAHVQGLRRGDLGRSGLNAIGRKILEEADVDEIVVQGGTRSTGRRRGQRPRPFRFPNG